MQARTRAGRQYGITLNQRDAERLRLLARFEWLTIEQLARWELGRERGAQTVMPDSPESRSPENVRALRNKAKRVRDRLGTLAAVHDGGGVGPLVTRELIAPGLSAWRITPLGAELVNVPWTVQNDPSPLMARHATMAFDVAHQLEAERFSVLAEREIATLTDQHGDEVSSRFIGNKHVYSTGKRIDKRSDLVVLSGVHTGFVPVEIERRRSRSISYYTDKLEAFRGAYWWLCADVSIARRVAEAARRVDADPNKVGPRALRIRVIGDAPAWTGIANLDQDGELAADLRALREKPQAAPPPPPAHADGPQWTISAR